MVLFDCLLDTKLNLESFISSNGCHDGNLRSFALF